MKFNIYSEVDKALRDLEYDVWAESELLRTIAKMSDISAMREQILQAAERLRVLSVSDRPSIDAQTTVACPEE